MTEEKKSEPAKQNDPMVVFRGEVKKMSPELAAALPPQITPEKFTRVVLTAVQNAPALLGADRKSLWNSCMKAAADGLLPDGREAALVEYKMKDGTRKVQYMPMIGGILKKVRNSGELATITSQIVHKNDKFRYWVNDEGEHVEHEPTLVGDAGARVGVYAMAKTKDNFFYFEFVTASQVADIRASSRAANGGPWGSKFDGEMWRKSALRRLSKRLPMSTDVEDLMRDDENLKADFAKDVTPAAAPVVTTVMDLMTQPESSEVEEATLGEPSGSGAALSSASASPEKSASPSAPASAPEASKNTTAAPAPSFAPSVAPPPEPEKAIEPAKAKSGEELHKEIVSIITELNWDNEKLHGFVKDQYKKTPDKLNYNELVDMLSQVKLLQGGAK